MTQLSLTKEQEAVLAELTTDAKQKLREMSELADALAQKYQKRLHEANLLSTQKPGK